MWFECYNIINLTYFFKIINIKIVIKRKTKYMAKIYNALIPEDKNHDFFCGVLHRIWQKFGNKWRKSHILNNYRIFKRHLKQCTRVLRGHGKLLDLWKFSFPQKTPNKKAKKIWYVINNIYKQHQQKKKYIDTENFWIFFSNVNSCLALQIDWSSKMLAPLNFWKIHHNIACCTLKHITVLIRAIYLHIIWC